MLYLNTKMVPGFQQLGLLCLQPLVIFSFIVYLFLFYKCVHGTKLPFKNNSPPSPTKLPILGNLLQLGAYPHRSLRSLSDIHGELMVVHLGQTPTLVVSSAKVASEFMKNHDTIFACKALSKTTRKLLYNCKDVAAAPYGEYWRQVKGICVRELLSNKKVLSFRSIREEEVCLLIERIEKISPLPVNLSDMFMTITCNVICRVASGRTYRGTEEGIDFMQLLRDFQRVIGRLRIRDFVPFLDWIDKFDGWDAKVDKVARKFDQFLEQILKEHQDRRNTGDCKGLKDFVDVLLEVQEDKTTEFPIERDSIKAILLDMLFAGTETTYTALEWAMTEILRHPAVLKELKRDVRGIMGTRSDINEDDLEQMKYLKAVIKETLRLHPPLPLLVPRVSNQDTKICGYEIPSGTLIITNIWAIQRDPASWNDPENFNPDRLLNCSIDFRGQDFQLIPFGAGRRICPGIQFATASIELVLANLIHKFEWTLPGVAEGVSLDTTECIGVTAHKKSPLFAVATPVSSGKRM